MKQKKKKIRDKNKSEILWPQVSFKDNSNMGILD